MSIQLYSEQSLVESHVYMSATPMNIVSIIKVSTTSVVQTTGNGKYKFVFYVQDWTVYTIPFTDTLTVTFGALFGLSLLLLLILIVAIPAIIIILKNKLINKDTRARGKHRVN